MVHRVFPRDPGVAGPPPAMTGRGEPSQLRVWLAATASYASIGTVFQFVPPYSAAIQRGLGSSPTATALAMTVFLLPIPVLAFPVGAFGDRHGCRILVRGGFAILAASALLAAAAPDLAVLLLARAVGGLGACLLMVGALKTLSARVPAPRLGSALGVFVAGLPIGTVVAFDILPLVVGADAWRSASLAAAVAVGLGFIVVWWANTDAAPTTAPARATENLLASAPLRWLLALTVLGYATIIAFTTWAPANIARYAGLTPQAGLVVASILLAVDIPAAPAWGRLSDRLGRRKPFLILAFAVYSAGAAVLPLAAHAPGPRELWLAVIVTVMGVGCAMFFPASLATIPVLVPADRLGAGYGLLVAAQTAGMAVGPLALGPVFNGPGTVAGLESVAALAVLGTVLATRIRAR